MMNNLPPFGNTPNLNEIYDEFSLEAQRICNYIKQGSNIEAINEINDFVDWLALLAQELES